MRLLSYSLAYLKYGASQDSRARFRNMADHDVKPVAGWMHLVAGRRPKRALARAGVLVVGSLVVFKFLLLPIRVVGISMVPTYRNGSVNFVNRISYSVAKPKRGDVVTIRMPGENVVLLKRIVALPGERVAIERGVVKINGAPLPEPYVLSNRAWRYPETRVDDDEYFVIGDNRTMDQGGHYFGFVKREEIIGKVIF